MQKNKINLIIIGGPSGSGKTTACNFLASNYASLVYYKNQLTTRKPRINEVKNGAYKSVPIKEFNKLLKQKEIIIKTKFASNYYGYKNAFLEDLKKTNSSGKVLIIDSIQPIKNWKKFSQLYPTIGMVTFFLYSDIGTLKERITNRQSIKPSILKMRLKHAKEILREKKYYDYAIDTTEFKSAFEKIKQSINDVINNHIKSGIQNEQIQKKF